MSTVLRKVKSIPFLMKKKKVAQQLEAFIQQYEPPSTDHYQDVDFLRRHWLAERLVDVMLLLHEQHDRPQRRGQIWYWGNDINRDFPMTY
jgi:hypothetical protein